VWQPAKPSHHFHCFDKHQSDGANHARFMTMTDLNAMLRMQLEHFGFLSLWELLDAAINTPAQLLEVHTPGGLKFRWQDGAVHSVFETFDWWANRGGGADKPAPVTEHSAGDLGVVAVTNARLR
jgi:hypothetical protein